MIQPFWSDIIATIKLVIGLQLDDSFQTIYLGNLPYTLNAQDKYLLKILLVASKKAITRKWLVKEPPTKAEWMTVVKELYDMERLTFSLRLCLGEFSKYWSKWITFLNRNI